MIIGPNDRRAKLTPQERAEAEALTEEWNEFLGIKPMTARQKAVKRQMEQDVLRLIGWKDPE